MRPLTLVLPNAFTRCLRRAATNTKKLRKPPLPPAPWIVPAALAGCRCAHAPVPAGRGRGPGGGGDGSNWRTGVVGMPNRGRRGGWHGDRRTTRISSEETSGATAKETTTRLQRRALTDGQIVRREGRCPIFSILTQPGPVRAGMTVPADRDGQGEGGFPVGALGACRGAGFIQFQ